MGYPAIAAGTVVKPGAGRIRASRLNSFSAASMPRVAPRSLSNARAWKNVAFLPVVASDSMRLRATMEVSYTGGIGDRIATHSPWSSKRGGSSSAGLASLNAIKSARVRTPDGFSSRAAK